MRSIPYPLMLLFPCLCTGLVVGYLFPSPLYIAPAVVVGAIAFGGFWCNRKWETDIALVVLCVLLGAGRMSFTVQSSMEHDSMGQVEVVARNLSDCLAERLRRSGLQQQEMHLTEALLLGRRDGLSSELKVKFRQVGGSHLLALSGMHLGILYGLFCFLCMRWVRFTRWRWLVLPLMIGGIWSYSLMAGMPASLMRAATMLSLLSVGVMVFRTFSLLHSLFVAATIMLVCNPLLLVDIGFQLSCMAVLFIALAYMPLQDSFSKWPKPLRWSAQMLLLSLSAQLGTLPLCAYYFHTFPLLGAVVSVVLVPLTSFLIYGGLFTLLFPVPWAASFVECCARAEVWVMDKCMACFPNSNLGQIHPSLVSVLLIYVVLLAGCARLYLLAQQDAEASR